MKNQKPPITWRYARTLFDVRPPTKEDATLDGNLGGTEKSLEKIKCLVRIERAETERATVAEIEVLLKELDEREARKIEVEEEIAAVTPALAPLPAIFFLTTGVLAFAAETVVLYQIVPVFSFAESGVLRWGTSAALTLVGSGMAKIAVHQEPAVQARKPSVFSYFSVRVAAGGLAGVYIICLSFVRYGFTVVEAHQRDPGGPLDTFLSNTPAVLVLLIVGGIVLTLVTTYSVESFDKAWRLYRAKAQRRKLQDRIGWIHQRVAFLQTWLNQGQDLSPTGEAASLDHTRMAEHASVLKDKPQAQGWTGKVRQFLGLSTMALVMLSASGCSAIENLIPVTPRAQDQRAVIVVDTTLSVEPERLLPEYVAATISVFETMPKCGSLLVVPVTGFQSGQEFAVKKNCEEQAFSDNRTEAREAIKQGLKNHFELWKKDGQASDYVGTLKFASDRLRPSRRRVLVVLGDMVNYTPHTKTKPSDRLQALVLNEGAFKDCSVFVGLVPSSSDLKNRSDAEREAFAVAWKKAFEKAGAHDVTERLHGLASVADWASDLKWEVQ